MRENLRDFDKKNEVPKHKTGLADEITQALGINGVYVSVGLTNKEMHLNKLDFTEHDKVFEDKIAELENIINHKLGDWDKHGITYQEILDMKSKNDKLKQKISDLESLMQKQDEFLEMKNIQIAELKQRIAELESKKTVELPFDPLECANYLINATYEREANSIEKVISGDGKITRDRYSIDDLEQIAEHLLVYCKHNKETEQPFYPPRTPKQAI